MEPELTWEPERILGLTRVKVPLMIARMIGVKLTDLQRVFLLCAFASASASAVGILLLALLRLLVLFRSRRLLALFLGFLHLHLLRILLIFSIQLIELIVDKYQGSLALLELVFMSCSFFDIGGSFLESIEQRFLF